MIRSPATIQRVKKHHEKVKGMCHYSCPRPGCTATFTDVNGCGAMTCSKCNAGVCQWCLCFCGEGRQPAYNHVPRCGRNRRPGTQEVLSLGEMNAVRDIAIKENIENYIRTNVDATERAFLLELLQNDAQFQKRGIKISL